MYAKELSEARNRQASSSSSASSCDSHSDNESRTTTFSNHVSLEANADEKTPRASRAPSRRDASSLDDGGQIKRDPRLWMYRYKSPPRPTTSVDNPSKKTPSSFKVPIYKEGTIVRIIGKIFINTTRGNERQIEVSSIQSLYEPGYIIGRRIYKDRGNKYAEWHHNVKCRKKRLEYQDRERVRELIGFESEKTNGTDLSNCISQSICHDVTMQDDSMVSFKTVYND